MVTDDLQRRCLSFPPATCISSRRASPCGLSLGVCPGLDGMRGRAEAAGILKA